VDDAQRLVLAELEIADLRVRLNESRKDVARLRRALDRRKRREVLVTLESTGDVLVYAGEKIDVAVLRYPAGDWRGPVRTLIEEWLDADLEERFADLHVPSRCAAWLNANQCPKVTDVYGRLADRQLELEKARRERERDFPLKDKANAQTKTNHRRHGAIKRGT
jgi:hypothetical protein